MTSVDDAGASAYAALRARGAKVGAAWGHGEILFDAALTAIADARSGLSDGQVDVVDTIELCLVRALRPLEGVMLRRQTANLHRGAHGLRLRHGEHELISAPTDMIARNQSFTGLIERFREECAVTSEGEPEIEAWAVDADQMLVELRPTPRVIRLERGSRLVTPDQVTQPQVETLASGLTDWMTRQVRADGRMTYKYWPSRGEESSANNMIRQWLATICLLRAATSSRRRRGLEALATRNLEHNLRFSYREEGSLGIIDCDGKVKLGAVALAALAIVDHPNRPQFADVEHALRRTVDRLWQEDGSFNTFYRPEGRNDNQNFYPGEALLLWATLYTLDRDERLLARIMRSFAFYREWHLDHRNPAFIPWHTQAYQKVWEVTRDQSLCDFVLEMNDWLLAMQQWDSAVYPEMSGQFYDPSHPEYGPPHASSTGVYLEGLIEAFRMARDLGDHARADAYRLAIGRGLRNLMQLQFTDELDMFYIAKKERARGALRTTTYDNTIRIDNVQHSLMAVLKILEVFHPQDYALEQPPRENAPATESITEPGMGMVGAEPAWSGGP